MQCSISILGYMHVLQNTEIFEIPLAIDMSLLLVTPSKPKAFFSNLFVFDGRKKIVERFPEEAVVESRIQWKSMEHVGRQNPSV